MRPSRPGNGRSWGDYRDYRMMRPSRPGNGPDASARWRRRTCRDPRGRVRTCVHGLILAVLEGKETSRAQVIRITGISQSIRWCNAVPMRGGHPSVFSRLLYVPIYVPNRQISPGRAA